jgi:hypothetical protein
MRRSIRFVFVASLVVLASASLFPPVSAGVASRPTTTTSASAPSRPAAAAETYPPKELAEACKKTAADLRGKLDKTFSIEVSPPFVVAGNMGEPQLASYTDGSVVRPAQTMWKCYFRKRPQEPITILLFTDANSYGLWAKKLLGDDDVPHFGYFRRERRTMVMNIATGTGTLVHELTHALIDPDFPKVPDWFNEGLASLHEQCNVEADRVVGLVNWRLPALQKAVEDGKLRSLEDLLTADDFYGEQKGLNYAQARYFCMYAQSKGLLEKFYVRLRDGGEGKRAGVDAVEAVFGKKIGQVEKDYLAWVKALR